MTASDKALLKWAADESRGNKASYETRAQQFGKYVEQVPEKVRDWIANYPGKDKLHVLPERREPGTENRAETT